MDASDLRVFHAVARAGGIGRGAAVLNTVQSNVTTRIRLLEEELGAALFHRHRAGVTLTEAGRRLLPYAEQMAELLREARNAVADDGTPRGALVIGSLETTAALRLPPILSAFAAAHPLVDLSLHTNTSACLATDVLENRLDGAFVAGPVHHAALAETLVFQEELVLVTARVVRRIEDLTALPALRIIVFRTGCAYRTRLEAFLAMRGIVGTRVMEFGTLGGIIGCVGAGMGVTMLPRAVAAAAARAGQVTLHDLPPAEARAETMFIRRADSHLSSAMAAFIAMARQAPLRLLEAGD